MSRNLSPAALLLKLLVYLFGRFCSREVTCAPGSDRCRKELGALFSIRDRLDLRINRLSVRYYDGRHPKHFLWREHNRYLFEHVKPGERVLDIGCGASHYTQWLAEKAAKVVGVDLNPERVAQARRNNEYANVRFAVHDVTRELPEGRFDVAICSHVLEHLETPERLLEALAASVPRLIVKVPLVDSHWMKLVRKDMGIPWLDDSDHRREYTEAMLREELERSGWQVAEMVRGYDLRAVALSKMLAGQG